VRLRSSPFGASYHRTVQSKGPIIGNLVHQSSAQPPPIHRVVSELAFLEQIEQDSKENKIHMQSKNILKSRTSVGNTRACPTVRTLEFACLECESSHMS
jgi:hypothetical protein